MEEGKKGGYGKRPLWQWILIYVVVAAIVYGAVYYFFLAPKGGYNNSMPTYGSSQTAPQSGNGY